MGMRADIAAALGSKDEMTPDASAPLREYGVGAEIIRDLGVTKMILLSSHEPNVLPGLEGYGLEVVGWRKI